MPFLNRKEIEKLIKERRITIQGNASMAPNIRKVLINLGILRDSHAQRKTFQPISTSEQSSFSNFESFASRSENVFSSSRVTPVNRFENKNTDGNEVSSGNNNANGTKLKYRHGFTSTEISKASKFLNNSLNNSELGQTLQKRDDSQIKKNQKSPNNSPVTVSQSSQFSEPHPLIVNNSKHVENILEKSDKKEKNHKRLSKELKSEIKRNMSPPGKSIGKTLAAGLKRGGPGTVQSQPNIMESMRIQKLIGSDSKPDRKIQVIRKDKFSFADPFKSATLPLFLSRKVREMNCFVDATIRSESDSGMYRHFKKRLSKLGKNKLPHAQKLVSDCVSDFV